jgi:hypothetical protein
LDSNGELVNNDACEGDLARFCAFGGHKILRVDLTPVDVTIIGGMSAAKILVGKRDANSQE